VQGFVPGLVVGYAEPGDGGGPVFKLGYFLVEGHTADQVVGALRRGQLGIKIRRLLGGSGDTEENGERREHKPGTRRHQEGPPKLRVR
jgi:hypothetical protein